MIRQR